MPNDLHRYLAAASYEGILFPAIDLTTGWGHDKAMHQGLLTPGADIQTTGRKPFAIHMRIALINNIRGWPNNLFPNRYDELMEKFSSKPKGILVHPTKGVITAHVDDISEHIEPKVGNGMFVDVAWTESATPDQIFSSHGGPDGTLNTSPIDDATQAASQADALIAALPASDLPKPQPTSPILTTLLAVLQTANTANLVAKSAFATALKVINGNINIAAEFGIEWHDYRVAAEATRSATYRCRETYFSNQQPTMFRVPVTMSLGRIAALPQVYNDPSMTYLLRLNNVIADETAVPAGTILTVVQALT